MSLDSIPIQENLANLDFEELVIVVLCQGSLQQRTESHGECGMYGRSTMMKMKEAKSRKQDQGHKEFMR